MHLITRILCMVPQLLASTLMAGSVAGWADQPVRLGNEHLQIELSMGPEGLIETECSTEGEPIARFQGAPWAVQIDGTWITPENDRVTLVGRDPASPSSMAQRATFSGEGSNYNWNLEYQVTGLGRITKFLKITAKRDMVLEHVALWQGKTEEPLKIAKTNLSDIAGFYRNGDRGLFVSLDFPYSRIQRAEGVTRVTYPPYESLKAGQTYEAHSLTIGSTRLSGKERYGQDTGEVEAMDAYIQERFQPRFDRPMFLSSCITNRYTYAQRNVIWYTYKDQPTLSFNTDLLKRDIDLMSKLGMEYYQIFPGLFDWGPDDPKPKEVHEVMDYARDRGIRAGDYSNPSGLFCGHFNDYSNTLDKPEWYLHEKPGKPFKGQFCLGLSDYVNYYVERVTANCKKYGFEEHCLDFLRILPCYAEDHGHPIGIESVYHQIKGLVYALDSMNSVSPDMMTWSNSGVWQDLLPKIAWHNHNLYLTDPFIMTPWQGLNMTRLLDDARREQMVSLHYSHFLPYRFFSNYQYFLTQNSTVPDIRNYQFGVLSTLAVTPNLSVGEIRSWMDKLPASQQDEIIAFYKKWTNFAKENFDLWKKTYHVGDNPGFGGVEIYGHAQGNRGFVFVVNPQYWDGVVELPLDEDLGFSGEGFCEMAELYPVERLCLTEQGHTVRLGTKLPVKIPAQQVRIFEIRPAPEKIKQPRLYGLPGAIEKTKNGYLLKTTGQQGSFERFAVLMPEGDNPVSGASVRAEIPKQPQRDFYKTALEYVGTGKDAALFDIQFRRTAPPTELREWLVQSGDLESGLASKWNTALPDGDKTHFPLFTNVSDTTISFPLNGWQSASLGLGPLANFCGAYVDNAFGEPQETWIDLETGKDAKQLEETSAQKPIKKTAAPLNSLAKDKGKQWWLQSQFHLPYIYIMGMEPSFDEHTILALPMFDTGKIKNIEAWINGIPLQVQRYHYPRNRSLFCHWADLVGSGAKIGENTLIIQLEFK